MKKIYKFIFQSEAEEEFVSLPDLVKERILKKLRFWADSGKPFEFAKRLNSEQELYRFRIGDYRVIFTPKDKNTFVILLILKVGHRKDIYE